MAGYRDTSNYDPYAHPRYGPPQRPYNWVQWCGVVLALVGIGFELAHFAAKLGWIGRFSDSPAVGSSLVLISVPLINSRRQEIVDPAPELAAARKRWLLIVTILCTAILGAAAAIEIARSQ